MCEKELKLNIYSIMHNTSQEHALMQQLRQRPQ